MRDFKGGIPLFEFENRKIKFLRFVEVSELIQLINSDRSSEWSDYSIKDWREGWSEWMQGEYYWIPEIYLVEKQS